jgi:hypothetical protein
MGWIEANGGNVDRWHKPEPLETTTDAGLVLVTISYLRVLGPEEEPEIPRWREWLGDVPVNILMLPIGSSETDLEHAKSLFPEAEVLVAEPVSPGGVF